jgi:tRNA pseudouridine38-40 synthase
MPRDIGYGAASRTDAGVSAIGNVLALDTTFRKDALLRALNAWLEDIWFHSLAEVPDGFQPRHAAIRWYRYHLMTDEIGNWNELRRALRLFVGKHDFTNFCRPEGKSAVRSIQKLKVRRSGPFISVDFFSMGFLWNQVRRIMGAALGVSRGELKVPDVKRALDKPEKKADLGLAPAEPLILMDVFYDFEFAKDGRALELARRGLQKKRREAMGTVVLASYLMPTIGTKPSAARRPLNPRL